MFSKDWKNLVKTDGTHFQNTLMCTVKAGCIIGLMFLMLLYCGVSGYAGTDGVSTDCSVESSIKNLLS